MTSGLIHRAAVLFAAFPNERNLILKVRHIKMVGAVSNSSKGLSSLRTSGLSRGKLSIELYSSVRKTLKEKLTLYRKKVVANSITIDRVAVAITVLCNFFCDIFKRPK